MRDSTCRTCILPACSVTEALPQKPRCAAEKARAFLLVVPGAIRRPTRAGGSSTGARQGKVVCNRKGRMGCQPGLGCSHTFPNSFPESDPVTQELLLVMKLMRVQGDPLQLLRPYSCLGLLGQEDKCPFTTRRPLAVKHAPWDSKEAASTPLHHSLGI